MATFFAVDHRVFVAHVISGFDIEASITTFRACRNGDKLNDLFPRHRFSRRFRVAIVTLF